MSIEVRNQQAKAWVLLILLALIWGSSFILIKKSLTVFTPGEVGAFRILAAGLVMLPLAMPRVKELSMHQMKYLLIIGLVGSFIPAFLFAVAQTQLDSSLTGVLNALTPLMVVLIGGLLYGSRITSRNGVGLGMALLGVVVLVIYRADSGWDIFSGINHYALLVLCATICYGFNVNLIKYRLVELKPVTITAISLMAVLPFAATYLFAFTTFSFKVLHVREAYLPTFYVAVLGVVGTALALVVFNAMVKLVSPVFASSVTYLIPLVAIAWGVLDGEVLMPWQLVGIVAIVLGVWVGNRKAQQIKG